MVFRIYYSAELCIIGTQLSSICIQYSYCFLSNCFHQFQITATFLLFTLDKFTHVKKKKEEKNFYLLINNFTVASLSRRYIHGKGSDDLHSLFPPDQTFTAKIHNVTYAGQNHLDLSSYFNGKNEVQFGQLLPKNRYFLEKTSEIMLSLTILTFLR